MRSSKVSVLLLCLVVVTLVSAVASTQVERRCREGKTFTRGCNDCFCSDGHLACTFKECPDDNKEPPNQGEPDDFWEISRIIEPPQA